MKIVIDANILFASLIKEGIVRTILFNENLSFYTPSYILEEFLEHIDELKQKTMAKKSVI